MTLPWFLAPIFAWLFLLAIPLIIVYFLKLKRPQQPIPSLALWRQVLNDQRVNSPFQKFKRNLLLLLQLLLLFCLVLAAMQPFLPAGSGRAQHLPVLIDCSASMGALDAPGGQSRLDEAKVQVAKLIDNLLPQQRLSLISFGTSATRLTEFTDNKRVLREALARLQVQDVGSRTEEALRLAQGMARTQTVNKVIMLTDGNVPPEVDFELPFELSYQKLTPAGVNLGIASLNAQRSGIEAGTEDWEIFVRVESSRPMEGERKELARAEIELLQDGAPAGTEQVSLAGGESKRIVFKMSGAEASRLEVRLRPEGFDSLAGDNIAFLQLPAARPLKARVDLSLKTFRHALESLPDVALFPSDDGAGAATLCDLIITTEPPESAPEAPLRMFVGVVPKDLAGLVTVETGTAEVVDWQRGAALLQHVLLSDVQIAEEPQNAKGVGEANYEQLGYEILAHGQRGPLLLQRRTGGRMDYFSLFHTDRSTLPYRVGFPILVANLVTEASLLAGLAEVRAAATGLLPPRTVAPERVFQVIDPVGGVQTHRSSEDGQLSGVAAPRAGFYLIRDGGTEVERIGVSLLDSLETSLAGEPRLRLKELDVAATEGLVDSDRPLWAWFAWLAFLLLIFEWWYFQRPPAQARN